MYVIGLAKAANLCQAVPILHLEMFNPLITIHICGRKRQGDEKVRRSFSELSDPLTLVFVFSPVGGGRLNFRLRQEHEIFRNLHCLRHF